MMKMGIAIIIIIQCSLIGWAVMSLATGGNIFFWTTILAINVAFAAINIRNITAD